MAKKHNNTKISASFHYLVKNIKAQPDPEDLGFSVDDFAKITNRITNTDPINFGNNQEIIRVKLGENVPFIQHQQIDETTHFGIFEGAYYGQQFRNSRLGIIDADSLNLRPYYYLLSHRRDGKIVVGVQYSGNFGDYDGIKRCFQHLLQDNRYNVISRTFSSFRHEIGEGEPVELKVNIRKNNQRLGGQNLFSQSGVFAIRRTDYGEDFGADVRDTLAPAVQGNARQRKAALAQLMNQGELLDIADDDIIGCSVLMRRDGRQFTVYLLGESGFATKFPVDAEVSAVTGIPDPLQVKEEMLRIYDNIVTPGLRR